MLPFKAKIGLGISMSREPFYLFHHSILFDKIVFPWWYIAIVRKPPCELKIFCASTTAQSRANIWYRSNAFKPTNGLGWALSVLCWLLLPLWDSVTVLFFVVRYFMSILVLQLSWWGRESWMLCLVCLLVVSWLLCGSSLWCHGFICSLWLWYFLIILTYYLWVTLNINSFDRPYITQT